MESVYQTCMAHELRQRGLRLEAEVSVPVMFKGLRMERGFRFLGPGTLVPIEKVKVQPLPKRDES